MWLQKAINRRVIKRAIGSDYVYQLEAEEKIKSFSSEEEIEHEYKKNSWIKWFIQGWINEIKKEIKK